MRIGGARGLAAAAALGAALALGAAAQAQERLTAQTVVDRAEIENLLERYYWNFGGGGESFTSFYTSDAELVLGKNSYKGSAGIESAYKSAGQNAPQVAGAVRVGVGEAPRVHLVDDPAPPRLIGHGGLQAHVA